MAGALCIGRTKVYDLLKSGAVPSLRIGQAGRIPAEAVAVLIASLSEESNETGDAMHNLVVMPSEPSPPEHRIGSLPGAKETG